MMLAPYDSIRIDVARDLGYSYLLIYCAVKVGGNNWPSYLDKISNKRRELPNERYYIETDQLNIVIAKAAKSLRKRQFNFDWLSIENYQEFLAGYINDIALMRAQDVVMAGIDPNVLHVQAAIEVESIREGK